MFIMPYERIQNVFKLYSNRLSNANIQNPENEKKI